MTLQLEEESWLPPKSLTDLQQEETKRNALNEVARWISSITGKTFSQPDNFLDLLANGVLLCELVNKLKPGTIKKVNRLPGPIAGMDNLAIFLKVCENNFGLSRTVLFQPSDLEDLTQRALNESQIKEEIDKRSLRVAICLFHLAKSTEAISSDTLNYSIFNSLVTKHSNIHNEPSSPQISTTNHYKLPRQSQSVTHLTNQNSQSKTASYLSSSLNGGKPEQSNSSLSSTVGVSKSLDCSTPRRSSVPDPLQFVKVNKGNSLAQKASQILTEVAKNKIHAKDTPQLMEDDEWQESTVVSSLSYWREKRRQAPTYSRIRELGPDNEEETIAETRNRIKTFKDMTSSGSVAIPSFDEDVPSSNTQTNKPRSSRWSKFVPGYEDEEEEISTTKLNLSHEPNHHGENGDIQTNQINKPQESLEVSIVVDSTQPTNSSFNKKEQSDSSISPTQTKEKSHFKTQDSDAESPHLVNNKPTLETLPKSGSLKPPPSLSNNKEITIRLTRLVGNQSDFGIQLRGSVENGEDVIVEKVKIGSTADICDVKKGDILRGINNIRIAELKSLNEVEQKLTEATGVVKLRIVRIKNKDDDEFSDEFSEEESVLHDWSPGTMSPLSPRGTLERSQNMDDIDSQTSKRLVDDTRISSVQMRNKFFGLTDSKEESVPSRPSIVNKYALNERARSPYNSENIPGNNNSSTLHSLSSWSSPTGDSEFRPLSDRLKQFQTTPQPVSPPSVSSKPSRNRDPEKVVSSMTMRLMPSATNHGDEIKLLPEISISSASSDKKLNDESPTTPEPVLRKNKPKIEEIAPSKSAAVSSKPANENHNSRHSSHVESSERQSPDRVQSSTLPRNLTVEQQIEAINAVDKRMSRFQQKRQSDNVPKPTTNQSDVSEEKISPRQPSERPTSIHDPISPHSSKNTQKSHLPSEPHKPPTLPRESKSPRPLPPTDATPSNRPAPLPPRKEESIPPPIPPKQSKDRSASSNSSGSKPNVPVVSSKKRCCNCNERLGSGDLMVIEAMQLYFHLKCFRCYVCRVSLGSGHSDVDVRVRMSRLHCAACYTAGEQQVKKSKRKGLRCSDV